MATRRGASRLPRAGGAWRWCVVLVLLAGLLGGWLPTAPVTRAAGIVVNSLTDVTANDGACTLREAIVAANTDAASGGAAGECAAGSGADTITFQDGLTGTITLTGGQLGITTDMTITGPGAGLLAVSGGNLTRVFSVSGGTITIADLTIKEGNNAEGGSGLTALNAATLLTLNNLDFTGNVTTASGGALYVGGATVLVTNGMFSGNTAANGGAIRAFGTGTIVSITGSTFSGNTATNVGGGIEVADGATLAVANSTFTNNEATNVGGGFEVFNASATVTNATFVDNPTGFGAQVAVDSGSLTARNTIVTGAGAACSGVTDGGGNLQYSSNDPSSTSCGAAVPIGDPLLGPLQNNGGPTFTHLPAAGSPAIDAGDNLACAAAGAGQPGGVDQRGVPRPQGLRCDAGAVEVAPPAAAPTLTGLATSPAPVVAGASGAITLTVNGTGFADGFSTVRINGLDTINGGSIATTYVSPTQLTATLPAFLLGAAGPYVVTVLTSPPGGGSSNPLTLTVTNPTPTLTTLAPTGATAGDGDTALTLTGADFAPGATVQFGGTALAATRDSAAQLTATIPAALLVDVRTIAVTVTNPGPGGGTSSGQSFVVATPAPGAPQASVAPASLAFGEQQVGTASDSQQVTVTNGGGSALIIAGVTLAGTNPGDFAITFNTCVGNVPASGSCVIGVRFAPTTAGGRAATLSITDDAAGSPQTVALSGTGTTPPTPGAPQASVAPASLTFPARQIGTASDSQQVVLTNTGGSPLAIGGSTLGGADPGDFAVTFTTCVGQIPAGGSCVVGVRFAPTALDARAATLSIADDAAGSPQTVALSGTGTTPPASPAPQSVVTASTTGQGMVSPSGATSYTTGGTATYAATPGTGQVFIGWTLDGQYVGYASPLTFTVAANRTLVATFVARPTFADVSPSDPDYQAITTLAALGIINPAGVNGSGQFQPSRQVARAEVAALLARTFGWDGEFHANPFPDKCDAAGNCIDDALWNAVAALADYGVVGGYTDGATCASAGTTAPCYLPRDQVSRVQVVSIVARAFTKTPDLRPTGFWERQAAMAGQYTNVPDAGTQRSDLATYRANAGAIPGQANDGTFPDPNGAASRRFIAQVLWQAYAQVYGGDTVP